ncbi:MAG TPA: T9SS type A sorting domain-containing protein, partial [bacterium]|nr:T9SS type A sorting domain-containing protein [bacterium]
ITFGAITVPNTPGSILTEAFVARLSPAGVWQWGVRAGGTNDDQGDALAFDGSGQIYVTGRFSSPTITLGTTSLTNVTGAPSSDIYVARLDTAGGWQWAVQTGGGGSEHGAALVAAGPDNLYVTGNFTAPATFGSIVLPTHMGRPTMFVAHLSGTAQGLPGGGADNPSGVFPNPARETVRLTGAAGPTAQLVDGLGRVVRTVAVREGEAILDLRGLPSGLYVVRAGEAMRRLVVE